METLPVNIDTITAIAEGEDFKLKNTTEAELKDSNGNSIYSYQNRVKLPGKHKLHQLSVRTIRSGTGLRVEGSPYAHKYGQNTFTSDDVQEACCYMFDTVSRAPNLLVKGNCLAPWSPDEITIKRIDLAVNLRLKSERQVMDVIDLLKMQKVADRTSFDSYPGNICIRPAGGSEYLIRLYAKGLESRWHSKGKKNDAIFRLAEESANILRIEIQLRTMALKKLGLCNAVAWKFGDAERVFREYIRRLRILDVLTGPLRLKDLETLPASLKHVYASYVNNLDLEQIYGKRTLQRRRKDFAMRGIDLKTPRQETDLLRGTSLKEIIHPQNACVAPGWLRTLDMCP